jgi:hypothetical protein
MAQIDEIKQLQHAVENPSSATRNKLALITGGILLVLTFMFSTQIVSGILALAALIVGIPILIWAFIALRKADPYIKQKLDNELLKLRVNEASKNRIEQLSNDLIARREKIETAKKARAKMLGQIKTLEKQLAEASPTSSFYKNMKEQFDKFQKAVDLIKDKIQASIIATDKFEDKVKEYKQYHKFTQTAQELTAALKDDSTLENMLTDVAFEAIDNDFNTAMADIDILIEGA